jgi:hypothetical protein
MKEPFAATIFCDDIRFEQQNKISLIGCYGPEMYIFTPLPAVLPKFGVFVQARFPFAKMPNVRIHIYMPEEEEPFFNQEIAKEEQEYQLANTTPQDQPTKAGDLIHQRGLAFPFLFSPLIIQKTGYIRVRLLFGEGVIVRAGALKISTQIPEATEVLPAVTPVPTG